MFCPKYPARKLWRSYPLKHLLVAIVVVLSVVVFQLSAPAQTLQRQLEAPEKVSVSIKNRDGRVTVNASDEQQKKVTIEATSAGLPVEPSDVRVDAKGESIQIEPASLSTVTLERVGMRTTISIRSLSLRARTSI